MTEEEFKKNAKTIPINIEKEEKAAIDYFKYKVLPTTSSIGFESKEEHYAKVLLNLIEKLQKENEEKDKKILGRKFYEVDLNELPKENYIRKDKIRKKLEELKNKEQELSDGQGYWGSSDLQAQIEILEDILEEEE